LPGCVAIRHTGAIYLPVSPRCTITRYAKDDRSALRDEIQELQEEAAALADKAKKTARRAEVLTERIKHLQT